MSASATHTISTTFNNGGTPIPGLISTTDDTEILQRFQVAASTTNELVAMVMATTVMKSMYWISDQTVTIKTNSSGSPAQTITLTAGVPLFWATGTGVVNPITTTVTALYVTNAGTVAANVQLMNLTHATP